MPFEGDEGSPPPMRGKASAPVPPSLTRGITPAYAGKRWFSVPVSAAGGDHPRLCGEKLPSSGNSTVTMGSPPPMRGKDKNDDFGVQQIGITPAYAGKSIVERRCKSQWRDHPRLCGEKVSAVGVFSPFNGSPPPMRGKGEAPDLSYHTERITPAYAGKRILSRFSEFL